MISSSASEWGSSSCGVSIVQINFLWMLGISDLRCVLVILSLIGIILLVILVITLVVIIIKITVILAISIISKISPSCSKVASTSTASIKLFRSIWFPDPLEMVHCLLLLCFGDKNWCVKTVAGICNMPNSDLSNRFNKS